MAADKAKGRVLLPDAVLPVRYDLRLTPDLEKFVFDGKIYIEVDVNEATSEVVMHAKELAFASATFKAQDATDTMEAVGINIHNKDKTVTFVFEEPLPVGKGTVSIEYTGILNNQMAGFYRSGYKDINGNEKVMASTQFESIDARRCFPCWDEPARKAPFAMTLTVDPALAAFSNMPEKSSKMVKVGSKYLREVAFMDSPKMSTYLVAFVVGEFDFLQKITKNGVLVRVYTPPGRSELGTFALDVAVKCLDLYDEFFGLPYPLPKLDMVAIPEFAMGAMENWGLVTYREADLLIDPKTASSTQKQRVCIVVTHELAHQWFGNLVTMNWWDDLWLNEGFASWTENWAADKIFPDYQIWEQFPSSALAAALRLDALESSHPIQVPINKAEEVEEVFDAISYCKGASVIRMAHAVIGHDAFQRGLQAYMKKHQYGNTETFDLWNAWAESSGRPVKDIMSSWTEQMGYPLIQVTSFSAEGRVVKLSLEQSWFLSSGKAPPGDKVWCVPLLIRTTSQTGRDAVLMQSKTMDLEVQVVATESADDVFVMINEDVVTPMRVAYTPEMRQRLARAVRTGKLSPAERSSLITDAYSLAKAGKLGLDEVLKFMASYSGEREHVVIESLGMVLRGTNSLLMGGAPEEMHNRFLAFAEDFVGKLWRTVDLGWSAKPTDSHTDGLLRGELVLLASRFAATDAWLAEARGRFDRYVEDPQANANELPSEYRSSVLQAVLAKGGTAEHKRLMEAYAKLDQNVEMTAVQKSVGWTSSPALKMEAMRWSIGGDIKIQDFFYIMFGVSQSSREGLQMMWSFFKSEFAKIHSMVKAASPSIMEAVIQASTAGFSSEEMAGEIEAFFDKNPLPQCKRKITQILEEIRTQSQFLKKVLATEFSKEQFWTEVRVQV